MLYPSQSAAAAARASALRKESRELSRQPAIDAATRRARNDRAAFLLRQAAYWDKEASRLADEGR